jgi:hypothetical protein
MDQAARRNYLMPPPERFRRHVVVHGPRAVLGGVTASATSSDRCWPTVFVAGTRSLGTSGAVLGLTLMHLSYAAGAPGGTSLGRLGEH